MWDNLSLVFQFPPDDSQSEPGQKQLSTPMMVLENMKKHLWLLVWLKMRIVRAVRYEILLLYDSDHKNREIAFRMVALGIEFWESD